MLEELLSNYGVTREQASLGMRQSGVKERVRFQFENSRSFGSRVLPSILFDHGEGYELLLVGYADTEIIENTLSRLNERGNYWPKSIHID